MEWFVSSWALRRFRSQKTKTFLESSLGVKKYSVLGLCLFRTDWKKPSVFSGQTGRSQVEGTLSTQLLQHCSRSHLSEQSCRYPACNPASATLLTQSPERAILQVSCLQPSFCNIAHAVTWASNHAGGFILLTHPPTPLSSIYHLATSNHLSYCNQTPLLDNFDLRNLTKWLVLLKYGTNPGYLFVWNLFPADCAS